MKRILFWAQLIIDWCNIVTVVITGHCLTPGAVKGCDLAIFGDTRRQGGEEDRGEIRISDLICWLWFAMPGPAELGTWAQDASVGKWHPSSCVARKPSIRDSFQSIKFLILSLYLYLFHFQIFLISPPLISTHLQCCDVTRHSSWY